MKWIIIQLIRIYQLTAPQKIRKACLFEPSCSEYMIDSIHQLGTIRGVYNGILRLKRCCPPHGGYDPVKRNKR